MEINRIIVWTVFLAFGVPSSVVGVICFIRMIRFRRNACSTLGTVIGHETKTCEDENRRTTTLYYPVVEYQDANGKTYRVTMSVGTSWIRYLGNPRVPILYEPGRPEQSVIHSFDGLWFGPFICLALGVMFIAIVVLDWFFKFPINNRPF